jgi:glycosyltransferase involved in cell wall biosynthesis
MRILAFYPYLNPVVNDIAHAMIFLAQKGHQVHVIAARANRAKSTQDEIEYEMSQGVHIYRPFAHFFPEMIVYPTPGLRELRDRIAAFRPDILLCSQQYTIRAGLVLKRMLSLDVPIVVACEFAKELADNGYQGILGNLIYPMVGLPRGKRFWPWLCRQANAIITSYPGDVGHLDELSAFGTPVRFVPWCNELPPEFQPAPERERDLTMFVGRFSPWKNTDALLEMVSLILGETATRRVVLVGRGRTQVVDTLKRQFGSAVEHIPGLPRGEALSRLSAAYYGITPVKRGGWGFIGDCWAVRTPLVTLFNDYELQHRKDSILGGDLTGLVEGIQSLYAEPHLYQSLQEGGYRRYVRDHSASAVGSRYEMVLEETLEGWSSG